MSEAGEQAFVVAGQIEIAGVELAPEVPLRVAAVRNGQVLAVQDLEPGKRGAKALSYRLRLPFRDPCSFRLILGRADVSERVFVATPLVERRISASLLAGKES